ncbi:MAG: hypothetical protein OHK0015_01450 [Chloroflexi bacterium OHK40]
MPLVAFHWVLVCGSEGKFEAKAPLSTDPDASPSQTLGWFVQRWQLEVTFEELRAHLGIETQRQWPSCASSSGR